MGRNGRGGGETETMRRKEIEGGLHIGEREKEKAERWIEAGHRKRC